MYESFFGLSEKPFTIAPDPRYVYLSGAHEEALAHLLYGIREGGGFVQLTGEVGTGKTTLVRMLLEQLPEHVDLALVFNPKLSPLEFTAAICDELEIPYDADKASLKTLVDALNARLFETFSEGRRTVLIIDEAQGLSIEVLEQVRLLTNLETTREKLLQIILVGQPELRQTLNRSDLRQLAQRITARYHLVPLQQTELRDYLGHRLAVAGSDRNFYSQPAIRALYKATGGIPRLVNEIADRALLAAYVQEKKEVDSKMVREAARQVLGRDGGSVNSAWWGLAGTALGIALVGAGAAYWWLDHQSGQHVEQVQPIQPDRQSSDQSVEPTRQDRPLEPSQTASKSDTPQSLQQLPAVHSDLPPVMTSSQRDIGIQSQVVSDSEMALLIENGVSRPYRLGAPDEVLPAAVVPPEQENEAVEIDSTVVATADTEDEEKAEPAVSDDPGLDAWILQHEMVADRDTAFKTLFSLWNIFTQEGNQPPCEKAKKEGMRCFSGSGNWTRLAEINRPAVLEIARPGGELKYVAIVGMDGDSIALRVGEEVRSFHRDEIDARWYGHFELLREMPPKVVKGVFGPGYSGPAVLWLRERIETLAGIELVAEGNERIYDAQLSRVVRMFQMANGLEADAIIGEQTLLRLMADSGPRLQGDQ